jgi:hypothetical protein
VTSGHSAVRRSHDVVLEPRPPSGALVAGFRHGSVASGSSYLLLSNLVPFKRHENGTLT